jgi:L-amino acid N-acyltransferase YncA
MLIIRAATGDDADGLWPILEDVIRAGETYPYDPAMTREQALAEWLSPNKQTYVALRDGRIVGTYYLCPNKPTLGAHVANAGYMVAADCRGQGVGRALGEHSITEAARLGYHAMQFNLVVATNTASVKLWRSLGFDLVGTLPGSFRHLQLGYVDTYVMYRRLVDDR